MVGNRVMYLDLLNCTLLNDLLDSLLLVRGAELIVENLLASSVKRTLSSVPVDCTVSLHSEYSSVKYCLCNSIGPEPIIFWMWWWGNWVLAVYCGVDAQRDGRELTCE